jgi:hypothetical protein
MSPHYRAARDGNKITIPENYIDKEYQAPSFSVNLNKVIPYGSFFFMPLIVYICLQFILNGADKIRIVIWRNSATKLIPKLDFTSSYYYKKTTTMKLIYTLLFSALLNLSYSQSFEKIRNNEAQLTAFFSQMPRRRLHHHFSGSIYADRY